MNGTNPPAQKQAKTSAQLTLPPRKSWLIFLVLLLLNYLLMRQLFPGPGEPITVPYTVFKEQAAKANVASIYSRGTSIEGRFKTAITWPAEADHKGPPGSKLPQPQPRTADT